MWWPSVRASDSRARGQGFDTYLRRVVSLSKDTFTPRKKLVIPSKQWLRPNMTEKLFTATLNLHKVRWHFVLVDSKHLTAYLKSLSTSDVC